MEVVGSINSATTLLDTDIELELDIIDPPKSVAGELLKLTWTSFLLQVANTGSVALMPSLTLASYLTSQQWQSQHCQPLRDNFSKVSEARGLSESRFAGAGDVFSLKNGQVWQENRSGLESATPALTVPAGESNLSQEGMNEETQLRPIGGGEREHLTNERPGNSQIEHTKFTRCGWQWQAHHWDMKQCWLMFIYLFIYLLCLHKLYFIVYCENFNSFK